MSEPVVRDNFTRGEAVGGITWLTLFAVASAMMEVASQGVVSVAAAAAFNAVLTRTALLWTRRHRVPALVPVAAWTVAAIAMTAAPGVQGGNNILFVALLLAGLAGGFWPAARRG